MRSLLRIGVYCMTTILALGGVAAAATVSVDGSVKGQLDALVHVWDGGGHAKADAVAHGGATVSGSADGGDGDSASGSASGSATAGAHGDADTPDPKANADAVGTVTGAVSGALG